jgi:hypothetical protein
LIITFSQKSEELYFLSLGALKGVWVEAFCAYCSDLSNLPLFNMPSWIELKSNRSFERNWKRPANFSTFIGVMSVVEPANDLLNSSSFIGGYENLSSREFSSLMAGSKET